MSDAQRGFDLANTLACSRMRLTSEDAESVLCYLTESAAFVAGFMRRLAMSF